MTNNYNTKIFLNKSLEKLKSFRTFKSSEKFLDERKKTFNKLKIHLLIK